jgi:glycosyltransferase involved in cell wall biosynthesis
MRVLQLGPYPPPHGGVQTNLVAIRSYLLREGYSCSVINLTRHRRPDADEVYYPKNAKELLQLLVHLRYDVLHLHLGGNLTRRLLALGLVCCCVPGVKAVMTFHSGGFPSSPEGQAIGRRSFAGFVLRRFNRLIAVNPEIEEFFLKCGANRKKVRLIHPHALAAPPIGTPFPEEVQRFFDSHEHVLLSVGLLEPEYDLPLQIEVMQRFPGVGLLMIGSGSLEEELRSRIQSKPYAKDILLAGDVPHAATLRAIQSCDMLIRTTLYDGDSISVREALHLGTPVIASDNGMRPAGCELFPISDLEALHAAIDKRLSTGSRRLSHEAGGDLNVKTVVNLYLEMLDSD